jgi:hypothetical protein
MRVPNAFTRRAAAMRLHIYRDESRSRHPDDLIGGPDDLVIVTVSWILVAGFACAVVAL